MSYQPDRPGASRSRRTVVTALVLVLVTQACASDPGPTLTVNGVALTEAEFYYGTNVEPHPDVTYVDDVVLVPSGAQAVRGVTPDGLTWRLDRRATGLADLAVGKVMFLTSRSVGRVVGLSEDGDNLTVTIAPVDLTEIFWEAEFSGDFEFDFEDMIVYESGEQAWTVTELPPTEMETDEEEPEASGPYPMPVSLAISEDWLEGDEGDGPIQDPDSNPFLQDIIDRKEQLRRPSWRNAKPISAGGFGLRPLTPLHDGVLGVTWNYAAEGKRIDGSMQAMASTPRVHFTIKIGLGRIERAEMRVDGDFSLGYQFKLESVAGIPGNINRRVELPHPISIPLPPIAGVSLNFTVSQAFLVRTGVSAKQASISAKGTYNLSGGFGFGYSGTVAPHGPTTGGIRHSLLNSIESTSMGVTGIVMGYRATFRVGIGWHTFDVGPFVDMISSIGVVTGSDLARPLPVCKLAFLNVWSAAGLSYRLPEILVDIFNFVLSPFTNERVSAEGEIARVEKLLIQRNAHYPNSKLCDPAAA